MPVKSFQSNWFMLTAHEWGSFFDESYDNKGRLFTVACLIARGNEIEKLQRSWARIIDKTNRLLASQGRKQITRYHASELNARDNEFEGWSREESKSFCEQLLHVLRKRELYAIAHTVILKDFIEVWPDVACNPKGFAYQHAMAKCLLFAARKIGPTIPNHLLQACGISVVYDRLPKDLRGRPEIAYHKVIDDEAIPHRHVFKSIAEGNAFSHVALQTADLLAYETERESEHRRFSNSHDMRIFLRRWLKGDRLRIVASYSNKQYFQELKARQKERLTRAPVLPESRP